MAMKQAMLEDPHLAAWDHQFLGTGDDRFLTLGGLRDALKRPAGFLVRTS